MIDKVLTMVFGSKHDRDVKAMRPIVAQINALEPEMSALSNEELRAKTDAFRARLLPAVQAVDEAKREVPRDESAIKAAKEQVEDALDKLLPEAFAVCREAGKRVLKMRHFDVQLMGGVVLHRGKIAEMKTGEGKTLVATLAVYLNALTGRGVHVVTVNDYLARRDSEWMGRLYKFLGLTVGVIQNPHGDRERQQAYGCDVTYGTNNEFGFDYLRDNMKFDLESMVQRDPVYAIIDEVDSILIDEARTPLIISGPSEESTDKYYTAARIVPKLTPETDFQIDEKQHTAVLTEEGVLHAEKLLGGIELYDPENMDMLHAVTPGRARSLPLQQDVEYVVKDGEVLIVDEFTGTPDAGPPLVGRTAPGGGGEGRRADRGGKPDPGHDHVPEPLPHVREAGRHDRHRRHRSRGVRQDLQPGRRRHPAQPSDGPRGTCADLVYRTEREKFNAIVERDQGAPADRAAGAGGHDLDREIGACSRRCSRSRAFRTSFSTRSTTSAKPRSSPRPAIRER